MYYSVLFYRYNNILISNALLHDYTKLIIRVLRTHTHTHIMHTHWFLIPIQYIFLSEKPKAVDQHHLSRALQKNESMVKTHDDTGNTDL